MACEVVKVMCGRYVELAQGTEMRKSERVESHEP